MAMLEISSFFNAAFFGIMEMKLFIYSYWNVQIYYFTLRSENLIINFLWWKMCRNHAIAAFKINNAWSTISKYFRKIEQRMWHIFKILIISTRVCHFQNVQQIQGFVWNIDTIIMQWQALIVCYEVSVFLCSLRAKQTPQKNR